MALLPEKTSGPLRLFSAPKPNYADYNGPPDGDYVRYVEDLMAWSAQEQERQRLQALGTKHRGAADRTPDSQWGRSASVSPAASADRAQGAGQPGSVDSAVVRLKRKAQAAQWQQQAATAAQRGNTASSNKAKAPANAASSWVLFIAMLIAVSIFATDWLPIVIMAWVVWNVIRAVRAASRSGKP